MKRPDGRNRPPYLMVGGPADGKRVDTLGDSVRVPRILSRVELARSHKVGDDYMAMNDAFEVVEYRKQLWLRSGVAFFVPDGQSNEETMRLLIQGYHQPKGET